VSADKDENEIDAAGYCIPCRVPTASWLHTPLLAAAVFTIDKSNLFGPIYLYNQSSCRVPPSLLPGFFGHTGTPRYIMYNIIVFIIRSVFFLIFFLLINFKIFSLEM
jgi:hypothetical protein